MPAKRKKVVEDPDNTWNMQLAHLLLHHYDASNANPDSHQEGEAEAETKQRKKKEPSAVEESFLGKVQQLCDVGADPVEAREAVDLRYWFAPYLPNSTASLPVRLPPLIIALLSMLFPPPSSSEGTSFQEDRMEETLKVIAFFLEKGATINDTFVLPTKEQLTLFSKLRREEIVGVTASNKDDSRSRSASRRKSRAKDTEDGASPSAAELFAQENAPEEKGTILHLLLLLKDHVYLYQFLYLFSPSSLTADEGETSTAPFSVLKEIMFQFEQNNVYHTMLSAGHSNNSGATAVTASGTGASRPASRVGKGLKGANPSSSSTHAPSMNPIVSEILSSESLTYPLNTAVKGGTTADRRNRYSGNIVPVSPFPPFSSAQQGDLFFSKTGSSNNSNAGSSLHHQRASLRETLRQLATKSVTSSTPMEKEGGEEMESAAPTASVPSAASPLVLTLDDASTSVPISVRDLADELKDVVAARLIEYFAPVSRDQPPVYLNGLLMTPLARACATGDIVEIEYLLDAHHPRYSLQEISADGRYTLIHYSVAQPRSLSYLVQRGLSMETTNYYNETALQSLLLHGTGRNSAESVIHPFTNTLQESEQLRKLPIPVQRNYILSPFPSLQSENDASGATKNKRQSGVKKEGEDTEQQALDTYARENCIGGKECDGWFAFCGNIVNQPYTNEEDKIDVLATSELIHNVIHAGANPHGCVQDTDLELFYVRFAEKEAEIQNSLRNVTNTAMSGEASAGKTKKTVASSSLLSGKYAKRSTSGGSAPVDGGSPTHGQSSAAGRKRSSKETGNNNVLTLFKEDVPSEDHSPLDEDPLSTPGYPATETEEKEYMNHMHPSQLTAEEMKGRAPRYTTPLIIAIQNYYPEMIKKFITFYNVDIMRRDSNGATALHAAAACLRGTQQTPKEEGGTEKDSANGGNTLMELLLSPTAIQNTILTTPTNLNTVTNNKNEMGANTGDGKYVFDINCIDLQGRTPLHIACRNGNLSAVNSLLQFSLSYLQNNAASSGGGNNNNSNNNNDRSFILQVGRPDVLGNTPLHDAIRSDNILIVKSLLEYQKEKNLLFNVAPTSMNVTGAGEGTNFNTSISSNTSSKKGTSAGSTRTATYRSKTGGAHHNVSLSPSLEYTDIDVEREDNIHHFTALDLTLYLASAPSSKEHYKNSKNGSMLQLLLSEGNALLHRPNRSLDTENGESEELGVASKAERGKRELGETHRLQGGGLLHRIVYSIAESEESGTPEEEEEALLRGENRHVNLLHLLLEYYADPQETDDMDRTPLLFLLELIQSKMERKKTNGLPGVLEEKAKEEKREPKTVRPTVLLAIQMLLYYGASVEAQSGVTLNTPIHVASEMADENVLKLMFYEVSNQILFTGFSSTHTVQEDTSANTNSTDEGGASLLKKLKERRQQVGKGSPSNPKALSVEEEEKSLLDKIMVGVKNCHENMKVTLQREGSEKKRFGRSEAKKTDELDYTKLSLQNSLWSCRNTKRKTVLHVLASHSDSLKQQRVMKVIIHPLLQYLKHIRLTLVVRQQQQQQEEEDEANRPPGVEALNTLLSPRSRERTETTALYNTILFFEVLIHGFTDDSGRLPLQEACKGGYYDIVQHYLLPLEDPTTTTAAEADQQAEELENRLKRIFYVDMNGHTVFHDLVLGWSAGVVEGKGEAFVQILDHLLQAVPSSVQCPLEGYPLPPVSKETPLRHIQAETNITQVLQQQRRKAPLEGPEGVRLRELVNLEDRLGRTPYLLSAQLGCLEAARAFLKRLAQLA